MAYLHYSGGVRFARVMVNKATTEGALQRMAIARAGKLGFGQMDVLADMDTEKQRERRYPEPKENPRIAIATDRQMVRVVSDGYPERMPVNEMEAFGRLVGDVIGARFVERIRDSERQVPLPQQRCGECGTMKPQTYSKVVQRVVEIDRGTIYHALEQTFQLPLVNVAVCISRGDAHYAEFREREVIVRAERESPIWILAVSFAVDGFRVVETEKG